MRRQAKHARATLYAPAAPAFFLDPGFLDPKCDLTVDSVGEGRGRNVGVAKSSQPSEDRGAVLNLEAKATKVIDPDADCREEVQRPLLLSGVRVDRQVVR